MTTFLFHGVAAGLAVALACGDSAKDTAAAKAPESGARPTARAPADPCALLTQAEAEAILGKPIAPPEKGSSAQCSYVAQTGRGDIMLHVLPLEFDSKEEFHAFLVKDTEALNARMKKGFKDTGVTPKETSVEPVPEVGSPAYYVDPTLVILKGKRVLSVLAADRQQAVAVAAKALPRFE
jgi:hypothetical protein